MAKRKMRRDVRERLAGSRLTIARAYCAAMGYRGTSEETVLEHLAEDTELATTTVTTVVSSAGSHMAPVRIVMLQQKLDERGVELSEFLDDPKLARIGVAIFSNPRRKPTAQRKPMLVQEERERLSTLRREAMSMYCQAVGSPASSDKAVVRRVARDSGYKDVSVRMVLQGCSNFSQGRLQRLCDRLGEADLDLRVLGDPKGLDLSSPVKKGKALPRRVEATQPASGPSIIVPTTFPCVVIFDADGCMTSIDSESLPGVVVVDEEGRVDVVQPPEGAVLTKPSLLEGSGGTGYGVIAVNFTIDDEQ